MNTLEKINRAKQEVAKEILEKIYDISEQCELNWESCNDMNNRIYEYIEKEHLNKSDYTK